MFVLNLIKQGEKQKERILGDVFRNFCNDFIPDAQKSRQYSMMTIQQPSGRGEGGEESAASHNSLEESERTRKLIEEFVGVNAAHAEEEEEVKGLEELRPYRAESFVSETDAFYYEYDFLRQSKTHSNQKVHKDLNEFATSVLQLTNILKHLEREN